MKTHLYFFFLLRLEKEYTTIKTKEMEEQVEIKVSISGLKRAEYKLIEASYLAIDVRLC